MSAPKSKATKEAQAAATVSDVSAFKARKKGQLLKLPSGLAMMCKRVELKTFILQGDVPNPLMQVVSEALEKGSKADVPAMMGVDEGKVDLQMVNDMYQMVDSVVCEVAVQPRVFPVPEDEADRSDDLVYVDEIDDEDKMFLFQWSTGGTSDVATFRREARADMDAVAKGPRSKSPAKRTAGTKAG